MVMWEHLQGRMSSGCDYVHESRALFGVDRAFLILWE